MKVEITVRVCTGKGKTQECAQEKGFFECSDHLADIQLPVSSMAHQLFWQANSNLTKES